MWGGGGGVSGKEVKYLEPVDAEDGTVVIVCVSGLSLALRRDLIDADLLVPAGDGEEILRGVYVLVKGDIGDTIGRRLLDRDILLEVADRVVGGGGRRAGRAE